jgi:pimeloyl-ACP methyl ester carboxylesterase
MPASASPSSSPRVRRRLGVAGALAVVAALIAACAPTAAPAPTASTPAADALERFTTQELAWEACDDYAVTSIDLEVFPLVPQAECARLEVPLDYDEPAADTASVAVVRLPARGESVGPLLYNPGGPGGPGLVGAMAASVELAESRITESFDLIGFDPRGVGATEPAVDCWAEDGGTPGDAVFLRLGTVAPALTEEDTRALAERCADGSGGRTALENTGTRTTANDMDVLRAALGENQISFLGQSYGTRLGTVYAEQFPERVRAMVLDGAFDPTLGLAERLLTSYRGFQSAFESMAASCAAEPDCPLGTDPDGWNAAFQALVQPLAEAPIPGGGAELDFDLALGGVMAGLYSPDAWPTIVDGLRGVRNGDGTVLRQLAAGIGGAADGTDPTNQVEALLAVNCADEERLTPEELTQLREDTYAQVPFMDPGTDASVDARDQCADFPGGGELGIPYAQDIEGLAPVLVVSLTGDPTTPHANALSLADLLDAPLLTVEGEGHTVVARGTNACVDEVASAYLIELEVPEDDVVCDG